MTNPRLTKPREPGEVYLVASSHDKTLRVMAERALATLERSPARIAISYAAASGPFIHRMSGFVQKLFGGAIVRRFTVEGETHAEPEKARAILADADLIFIGGGDPVQGARLLVNAGADAWIREARAKGTPCLGISAGAIMLCAWWADWPEDPPSGAPHEGGRLVPCTRVAADLVVDCHAEEDDWNELRLVRGMLRDQPGEGSAPPRFLGLPTGTGIVVSADGTWKSVGGEPFRLE